MGGITDEQVEWAVVNRLKAMLDQPPKTKFNVTLSFALCSVVLLWSKNRIWLVGDKREPTPFEHGPDFNADAVRSGLRATLICEDPWGLSRHVPSFHSPHPVSVIRNLEPDHVEINSDFENMSAEAFVKWLRDASRIGTDEQSSPSINHPEGETALCSQAFAYTLPSGATQIES